MFPFGFSKPLSAAIFFIYSLASALPCMIFCILTFLIVGVLALVLYIYLIARFMKILITLAIAPIGISFFAGEPTSRTGFVFMKSYIGDCLFGCILAIILKIYGAMMTTDIFQAGGANNVIGLVAAGAVINNSEIWQYCLQLLLKTILFTIMIFSTRTFIRNKFEM